MNTDTNIYTAYYLKFKSLFPYRETLGMRNLCRYYIWKMRVQKMQRKA